MIECKAKSGTPTKLYKDWAPLQTGGLGKSLDQWRREWPLFDFRESYTRVTHPNDPDNRFPHRCPKCGDDAYVGLNQIEHMSKKQDTLCH